MDRRFKWLLEYLNDGTILITASSGHVLVDELLIPGMNTLGFVCGSYFILEDFLAINSVRNIYTLSVDNNLEKLSFKYGINLIDLQDEIFKKDFLKLQLKMVKYLGYQYNLNIAKKKIGIYGYDDLANEYHLPIVKNVFESDVIVNFDKHFFELIDVKDKIIFDLTDNKYGFMNLYLKEAHNTFFAINQYLGQLMTKTGAKIIYDSLVRNRVSY